MKILNLYAGIGGNRKLWGDDHEITAVEINKDISKIYKDFYPNDNVIVADAHEYLRFNFKNYDFIWSSPPCPTHSRLNFSSRSRGKEYKYPDMKLYEEIIFLKTWFKGKWIVENVRSYYEPLIKPQELSRHYFWTNFLMQKINIKSVIVGNNKNNTLEHKMKERNIYIKNWHNYKGDKRTLLNNCVDSKIGLHILNAALGIIKANNSQQNKLF
tara:strand:- start:385 stop:1023 length:639 start_codon:yes stop_codon:yes gene_type:complete